MKKILSLLALLTVSALLLVGCTNNKTTSLNAAIDDATGNNQEVEIPEDTVSTGFSLVDENSNELTQTNGVYTITTGGTYTAVGKLENGQIYVDAADQDVELVLEGASISNSSVVPIYAKDVSKLTIKAKNDTTNYIYDNRTTDYSDTTDDTIGDAAIYSLNGNIKLSGKGTLTITSLYNSGVHSKDNVTVQNLTLLIKAMDNGIKGNDKVTFEENPTVGIVCGNNGVRTSNSEVGTNAQHGYIYITGGSITINSYGDGIDAAYAVVFDTSTGSDGVTYTPSVDIYTNIYSSYSTSSSTAKSKKQVEVDAFGGPGGNHGPGGGFDGGGFSGGQSNASKAENSAKGIKANESITVNAGNIFVYAYDDGLHTNNDTLDSGLTAQAIININGGTLNIKVSDDGIHADGTLNIKGGTINVTESHEGIEANIINVSGGETYVKGSDDGVNTSKQLTVSGGRLDVTVSASGDVDGIDSNGTISITGGIIITRGPNSDMAGPIDADSSITVSGGTLIVIGYFNNRIRYSGLTKSSLTSGLSSGTHTVTIGSTTIEYSNSETYRGSVTILSSASASIK